jgi:hypothetical protein
MKTSLNLRSVATKTSRFRMAGLFIPIVVAAILFATPAASADPWQLPLPYALGLNGAPIVYSVPEAIPSLEVTFWYSTFPGDPVDLLSWTPTWGYVSGDPTDQVIGLAYAGGTCVMGVIYPANTDNVCSVELTAFLPDEVDYGDFGISYITLTPYAVDALTGLPGLNIPGTKDVQVNDDPEPGTILLLGTGLLGMAGVIRRKLRRA